MNPDRQDDRHNRQMRLPRVGPAGQKALEQSSVLVVGCGGLGSPVVQYLAAAGVGRITLMDDDRIELSNLNRQILHREKDIGRSKTERAKEWIEELDAQIQVTARFERLGVVQGRESVRGFHLIMDCTDGFSSKFLLNDVCVLENVTHDPWRRKRVWWTNYGGTSRWPAMSALSFRDNTPSYSGRIMPGTGRFRGRMRRDRHQYGDSGLGCAFARETNPGRTIPYTAGGSRHPKMLERFPQCGLCRLWCRA